MNRPPSIMAPILMDDDAASFVAFSKSLTIIFSELIILKIMRENPGLLSDREAMQEEVNLRLPALQEKVRFLGLERVGSRDFGEFMEATVDFFVEAWNQGRNIEPVGIRN